MGNNTKVLLSKLSDELGKVIDIVDSESQNNEYQGMLIKVDGIITRFRVAKVTPKKTGSFVAFWEKDALNKNKPYELENSPSQLFIYVEEEMNRGYFLFDKEILSKKQIYTSETGAGKMAMRVYPSWWTELNKQATLTQKWQSSFFTKLK